MMMESSRAPSPSEPNRRAILAWCLYDWAVSAFNTVILTFVFSLYFARGIVGDETAGGALWSTAMGVAGLIVAALAPVLGAIADRGGARKPWLGTLTFVFVIACAALWFAAPAPGWALYALIVAVIATAAFELANVFYAAMLPDVAPARMIGRVSGWGWGLGYFGGLASLALCLFGVVGFGEAAGFFGVPQDDSLHARAVAPIVALWVALFALPLFLFTPDRPTIRMPAGEAVRSGLATLWATLKRARQYRETVKFLIASAFYRDGLGTLFAVAGVYAGSVFGLAFSELLMLAIAMNVASGLGAFGFAFLDDRIGGKRTVLITLAGFIVSVTPILFVTGTVLFFIMAMVVALFIGPIQAASRAFLARQAPPMMVAEFFGLYALTGKSIAFVGPFLFGLLATMFDSLRAGAVAIMLTPLIGFVLLLAVKEEVSRTTAP